MGNPGLSKEQMQQAIDAYAAAHNNYRQAAKNLRIAPATFRNRLDRAISNGFVAGQPSPEGGPTAAIKFAATAIKPPEHKDLLALRRSRDQNHDLKVRIKELERLLNERDDTREAVFGLIAQQPPRTPIVIPEGREKSSIDIPALLTSDFQYGEMVDPEEIDGINAYNREIAQRRYRFLIESTLALISDHVVRPAYPALIYARLGDAISGRIHDELAETNDGSDPECVRDLTGLEADGIHALHQGALKATKQRKIRIRVLSIPGNHGRTTRKPHAKSYVRSSWETLLAWNLEREFRSVPDIEFVTPMSGDIYEPIYNTRNLLTHGDRIGSRGGTGFIGSVATVARGVHKIRQQYSALGKPIDYVWIGHFHDPSFNKHFVVNNNLCGHNEFAGMMMRVEPAPPSQSLLWFSPKWGMTVRREIILEEKTADGRPWNNLSVEPIEP